MRVFYWVVRVAVHAPKGIKPMPVYSEELGAAYVADVAPALVRHVETGSYCVLADWSICEVLRDCKSAEDAQVIAAVERAKHPDWDVRELATVE